MSTDDAETNRKFRDSLKSRDAFVSDEKGELVKLFDVKMPLVNVAKRATFVIGENRKILKVDTGGDAIDAASAVEACPLRGHQKSEAGGHKDGG